MRYSDEVRQFWSIGKRLFHGKFLNYMRGPCYTGQLCTDETERGHIPPCLSKLNFPVPNEKHLSCPTNIPDELKPGILEDMIKNFIQRTHES